MALGQVGFRTIAWDRADGRFDLRVNGVSVFCRGACWTPLDPVSLRADPERLDAAIAQVRRAGMNMVRVGGPFVHEEEAFFDACDKHGVMVWQDFMFANMDYPDADPAFADSVRVETVQLLGRLQGRPSLAILCGSSESEQQAAMWGAPRDAWSADLFHKLLPELVAAHLPEATYWPSSAHGGAFPHQVDAGTTSYYGVGAYMRPLDDARRSDLRFATECLAFANVPGDATIDRMPGGRNLRVSHAGWKARAPRDLGAGWDFEDVRDHYLASMYDVSPARLRAEEHDRYLELSAAVSGDVMTAAFSEWRRKESRCGGALIWFMRDLWAGAGWGVLDDAGRPKACWHALSRALQPRTVLLTDEGNSGLVAHVVNERSDALEAVLEIVVWRGTDALTRAAVPLRVEGRATAAINVASALDSFMDLTHAFRFGPVAHDATSASLRAADGSLIAQVLHYPQPRMPVHPMSGLAAVSSLLPAGDLKVRIESAQLARGVHFDAPGYVADDAWFDMVPGETREVVLRTDGAPAKSSRRFVRSINGASINLIKALPTRGDDEGGGA